MRAALFNRQWSRAEKDITGSPASGARMNPTMGDLMVSTRSISLCADPIVMGRNTKKEGVTPVPEKMTRKYR